MRWSVMVVGRISVPVVYSAFVHAEDREAAQAEGMQFIRDRFEADRAEGNMMTEGSSSLRLLEAAAVPAEADDDV